MTPDDWSRVKVVFDTAVDLPAEEQARFVATATAGDSAVQAEVERLLAAERARASGFLEPHISAAGSPPLEPHPSTALQPGEVFAGRYEIQHELGRGGFGVVYAAFDRSRLQRNVALKVIRLAPNAPSEATELGRRRFFEEVRIAANLSHTNIAGVYEAGESGEWVYMTQELAPGRDLRRILEEEGALPPQRAVAIARQLCAGLAHAHARGVVHRDIKPRNIIVGADDHVKVTDFGIAQPPQEDSPLSGAIGGTLGYMAPEQLREGRVDGRADIFAVGCVLYEMLAGRRPFEGATTEIILEGLHPEPGRVRGGLPHALDRIVTRAMRKNRDERYGDISQLQKELIDYEESRHLWPAAVAAAALLVAVATIFYFRYGHRAPRVTKKDTVVIADFINSTEYPDLGNTLRNALAADLGRSPSLSVLSAGQVAAILQSINLSPGTGLTPDVALEVCRRAGGRAYVVGSITAPGLNHVLGLKPASCVGDEALPERQKILPAQEKRGLEAGTIRGAELLDALNDQAAVVSQLLSESKPRPRAEKAETNQWASLLRRINQAASSFVADIGWGQYHGNPSRQALAITSLVVTPTMVDLGSDITLVASVRDRNGAPVTDGSITFYDGATVLGTVRVVANPSGGFTPGTATLKTFLTTLGANRLTARYAKAGSASTSAAVVATVTGKYSTTIAFTYDKKGNDGIPGFCTFIGTVAGAGPATPTGDVDFVDAAGGFLGGRVNFDTSSAVQSFVAAQRLEGFVQPTMTALADLNGDGIPDLIVTDHSGVAVELGNGDGTFRSPARVTSSPVDWWDRVALGDFNADGRIDLAVLAGGGIRVFFGNGDGSFVAHGSFDSGSGLLAAADFNGDGILDLVATNKDTIDLLLGNGDGTFRPAVSYPVKSPLSLAVGDVNRDGYADVVVAAAPHDVTVFLGHRDGTLRRGATYAAQYEPGNMILADLRGKGDLDLVTAFAQCCEYDERSVDVMRGNGDGTFQPAYTLLSGPNYLGLAVGDFNEDGKLDLVVSNYGYPVIDVLPGNGDGTFLSAIPYHVGMGPTLPAVADLNRDGRSDIAVANYNVGDVDVLLNQVRQSAGLYPAVVPRLGRQLITARYLGDANFAPSTSATRSFTGYRDNFRGIISPCPGNPTLARR